jgi:phosphohistidine phosphatase SixA
MAAYSAALGSRLVDPQIAEVRHSGKLRARQTAEIISQALYTNYFSRLNDTVVDFPPVPSLH